MSGRQSSAVEVAPGIYEFWVDDGIGEEGLHVRCTREAKDLVRIKMIDIRWSPYDQAIADFFRVWQSPIGVDEMQTIIDDVDRARDLAAALTA